jgi:RNA polymerase sigma factor (sigma-70 family)
VDQQDVRSALGVLCALYWYPLYAFARRRGLAPEDAEDATQAFFLSVLERGFFASADPERGRLRTFLLTSFSRQLVDAHRTASREKRGGGVEFVPLETDDAEIRFAGEPSSAEPAAQFEKEWAAALIEGAVRRLKADYAESGKVPLFDALLPFLGTSAGEPPDQAQLATQLGMSHVALRQSLLRLRTRFRTVLRAQVSDTLREPTDAAIDEELRALHAVLAGTP